MDSVCEEDNNSVFSHGSTKESRQRSPSLPVVTTNPAVLNGIHNMLLPAAVVTSSARTRSPSLPASGGPPMSNARRTYTDRSDSGISDCSNHSSALLSSLNTPWLIQEEDESGCNDTTTTSSTGLTNGTHLIHSGGESNGINGGSNKAASGVVSNNKNRIIE